MTSFLFYLQIFFIFFLLLSSAFFSGSETALTKLSKIKVKHWIYSRSANSEAWANWLSRPQELITTILVGNTLTSIFFSSTLAALAMRIFTEYPQEWIQTIVGILALFLLLVFGEIVPKIYCLQNAEKVSSFALKPLFKMSKFLGSPLKNSLDLLGKIFPIFIQPTPGRISTLTLDEIRAIIQDQTSLQGLEKEHQEMMRRVLEMHQTTVAQIMTPWRNVEFLSLDEALGSEAQMERFMDRWVESGRTRLPLVRGTPSRIIGYLYVKDLLLCIALEKKIGPHLLSKWIRQMPAISPEKKISEILDIFRFGSPMACVQDRSGFPLGIITLEDVLEEFIGEILDEYDFEKK